MKLPDGVHMHHGKEPIDGVKVIPLRRIPDERGTVMHMLRSDDPHFQGFGEIYFSTVYRDAIKGWHRHAEMALHYACIVGRVKCVVHDDRPDSPTRGHTMEVFLGPDSYNLLVVPPRTWNGFKGLVDLSMVANACTHPHDPARSERLDPYSNPIPYRWERQDH